MVGMRQAATGESGSIYQTACPCQTVTSGGKCVILQHGVVAIFLLIVDGMKCKTCGRIVRKDHGQLVPHLCKATPVRPRRRRVADRETQLGRYLDAGPAAWDDRD